MLLAQSMGSHGGQQNFPFGYLPSELHGIGLPDFMTPGPPSGRPLLSEHDAQNFNSFLNGFDNSVEADKDGSVQHFQQSVGHNQEWMMPPMFVGSETSLRAPDGADYPNLQMSDFTFGQDMNLAPMPHAGPYQHNMQDQGFPSNGHYDHNILNQLHDAAQTVQPTHGHTWQQNYPPQVMPRPHQQSRPIMRFGSDSHFQPTGYTAPDGQFEHAPSFDWLEAQSSAANTQPNTEPNTQPSSPVWSKKRKVDEYQADGHRTGPTPANGYISQQQNPAPKSASRHHKRPSVIADRPPPMATQTSAKQKLDKVVKDEDLDLGYDDDDDGAESPTESMSPTSGSKSANNDKKAPLSKSARSRKKSTASMTSNKIKPKPSRSSTVNTATSRTPLTADQKKANHTNSEQRRRDATAKAYADLYDLVPELEEVGKQSTMKKLEVVVSKVEKVRNTVRQLRLMLGFDQDTGAPLQSSIGHAGMAANPARPMGGFNSPSVPTWPH